MRLPPAVRTKLKRIPMAREVVGSVRDLRRRMRTEYLRRQMPNGGFLRVNGLDLFCDFSNPTYVWYDGEAANRTLDLRVMEILIAESEGDVFVDIGAHFGLFSVFIGQWLARHQRVGHVIALEPDPAAFPCLDASTRGLSSNDVRVQAVRGALAATDRQWGAGGGEDYTFDRLIAEHAAGGRVAVVKIDIDGPEPLLFSTGRHVLERDQPFVFLEFSPRMLRNANIDARTYFAQLTASYLVYWLSYKPLPHISVVATHDYERIVENVGEDVSDLVLAPFDHPLPQLLKLA